MDQLVCHCDSEIAEGSELVDLERHEFGRQESSDENEEGEIWEAPADLIWWW